MGKLYDGGASFGFSLNFNTAVPVDTRFVVQSLSDLKNPQTWVSGKYDATTDSNNVYVVYPGLNVIVVDEKTIYVFGEGTVNGTTIAADSSWTRLATGDNTDDLKTAIDKILSSIGLDANGDRPTTAPSGSILADIKTLETEVNGIKEEIGTSTDTATDSTVYGKIAEEKKAREDAIAALDSDFDKSDAGGFVNLKIKQENGVITSVAVATSDIAKESSITGSDTLGKDADGTYEIKAKIKYVAATTTVPAHIALVDKNETELSTVPVQDIIGNGLLKSHYYDSTTGKLTLTFNKADGTTQDTEIDLGKMLDIDDVLIHADSQKYLSVDLSGAEQSQAVFKALIVKLANATTTNTGLADAYDVKKYVDDVAASLVVTAEGDDYVSARKDTTDNKKIVVSANVSPLTVSKTGNKTTISGTAKTLVDGKEVADKVEQYVEARITELDSTATSTDGTHVTVKVTEEDGKVTAVNITESDIASAALLGGKTDDKTKDTAFGRIAKEANDRATAISNLGLEATDTNAKAQDSKGYVKTVISETSGVIKNESVSVTYGSVADRTPGIATAEDVAGNVRFEKGTGTNSAILKGTGVTATNEGEVAVGKYNNSATHATDDSAKTLFSVGNGTSASDLHNAVEVRENGDIWINIGSDYKKLQTLLSNEIDWYEGA